MMVMVMMMLVMMMRMMMMMVMVMMMRMMMMMIFIIAVISAGHGGGDRGMRCKKLVAVMRVVVPRARDAGWQFCTTTDCNRIACTRGL